MGALKRQISVLGITVRFGGSVTTVNGCRRTRPARRHRARLLLTRICARDGDRRTLHGAVTALSDLCPGGTRVTITGRAVGAVPRARGVIGGRQLVGLLAVRCVPSRTVVPLSHPIVTRLLTSARAARVGHLLGALAAACPGSAGVLALGDDIRLSVGSATTTVGALGRVAGVASGGDSACRALLRLCTTRGGDRRVQGVTSVTCSGLGGSR